MVNRLDLPNHLGLDSLNFSYHENGAISRKRVFSDVTYKETIYYSNGQLFSSQTYFHDRLIDTIQIYFHRNGKILATGKTKHAARIGLWKFFYKNGQLRAKGKYSQGTKEFCNKFFAPTFYHYKIGYWEYWYENGLPMARGHYEPLLTESIDGGIPEEIQVAHKESDWKFWNQEGTEITEFELYKAGLFTCNAFLI